MIGLQIFALAPEGVIDAAVQNQFARPAFQRFERNFAQKRDRIMIQPAPARRIQIAE